LACVGPAAAQLGFECNRSKQRDHGMSASKTTYAAKILPSYIWQRLSRRVPSGPVHLIFALADHFEPAIDPRDGQARVSRDEQFRRLEWWCREYPKLIDGYRDHDGRAFVHSYFYPAEQYDAALIDVLAEHCHAGWGEIEIHLHHGIPEPDTAENTRRVLTEFRDALAFRHQCLALDAGSETPRYAFVHGNFALANSAEGKFCGVDSEMAVLAETGCFADMTLPTSPMHPSQTKKINSLYECALPLDRRAPQRQGRDLRTSRAAKQFPLIVQGPLTADFGRAGKPGIENGSITRANPLSIRRLALWKQAAVRVEGRSDWLFIKVHAHSMDPTQKDSVAGEPMRRFLEELVQGASARQETLHFTTAREMTNIILAACDGREGNPGDYRDYRFRRFREASRNTSTAAQPAASVRG
jgi:hypothetical protein